jgi:FAD/FMN-containing dehydrogenase
MRRIVGLDAEQGVVEAEAGIQWPELIERVIDMQSGQPSAWGIIQKQTGADRLTLGGALGANIHGRGLALKPIIGDVESFTLMHSGGSLSTCSRTQNRELFSLAIGGYGLFGVVIRVRLRLRRRTKLERIVRIVDIDDLMPAFAERIAEGYLYGDWQFSTDAGSDTYLRKGVFSCYRPLPAEAPMPANQKELDEAQWRELYRHSHADTRRAYDAYTSYYLSTSGQRYWSDLSQLGVYIDDYHAELDRRLDSRHKGSEMITELYVPRPALAAFLAAVRTDFTQHGVGLIYGTIRLIERDEESVLAWAREPWVCTVMNLHVDHTPDRIAKTADDFRRLIDRAIEFAAATSSPITAGRVAAKCRRAIHAWSSSCARSAITIQPKPSRAIGIAITSACSRTSSSRPRRPHMRATGTCGLPAVIAPTVANGRSSRARAPTRSV